MDSGQRPSKIVFAAAILALPCRLWLFLLTLNLKRLWRRLVVRERGVRASVGTIWTFLDRAGLTFKKSPRMRWSRTALTS